MEHQATLSRRSFLKAGAALGAAVAAGGAIGSSKLRSNPALAEEAAEDDGQVRHIICQMGRPCPTPLSTPCHNNNSR